MSKVLESKFCELIGMRLLHAGGERAEIELEPREEHRNHVGAVAGGVIMTLLDAAGGVVARGQLDSSTDNLATTDMATQFWSSAAVTDRLVCCAELVHRSGRAMRIEATVSAVDRTIAKAFMTYVVVSRR